jgi:hypothetical protein
MTDKPHAVALDQASPEASALRCPDFARTDWGWERCHRDVHGPDTRHHVRDRSWSTAANTPRLRLGQPCTKTCTWPDEVIKYRGMLNRRT